MPQIVERADHTDWHRRSLPPGAGRALRPDLQRRHIERARICAGRNEVLVVLVRSAIGSNWRQKRILASLGLRKRDTAVIGPREGWFLGQVKKVEHLVNVAPLSDSSRAHPGGGSIMGDALEHEMSTHTSGSRVFAGGEYVEWSRGETGTSLIWSSELSLPELITAVDSVLGEADADHRGLVDFDDVVSTPVTAEHARTLALRKPEHVTFLRLEYASGVALVWTPTPGTDELNQRSDFAEASVLFGSERAALAAATMGRTATRGLVKVADRVAFL